MRNPTFWRESQLRPRKLCRSTRGTKNPRPTLRRRSTRRPSHNRNQMCRFQTFLRFMWRILSRSPAKKTRHDVVERAEVTHEAFLRLANTTTKTTLLTNYKRQTRSTTRDKAKPVIAILVPNRSSRATYIHVSTTLDRIAGRGLNFDISVRRITPAGCSRRL